MTREEQIKELARLTCFAYCRNKEKKCSGIQECDMKCLHYQRCEIVYDNANYRKQVEAEWIDKHYLDGAGCVVWIAFTCSHCQVTNGTKYDYCPSCGAKMKSNSSKNLLNTDIGGKINV